MDPSGNLSLAEGESIDNRIQRDLGKQGVEPVTLYVGAKYGYLDEVIFQTIKSDATRVAALLSGDIDMMDPVPVQDVERVKQAASGEDVAAIRRAGIKLGISTHSHEELARALCEDPDYVALGPIYETKLKVMPWAPQGLDRISEWKALAKRPLVAIGGITLERAPLVFDAGADSIAVVTDVVAHADPEARTREWLEAYPDGA